MTDSLANHNPPIPSVFDVYYVDESLPKEERAFETWKALLTAKRSHEALFLAIGKLLKSIRDDKLFEVLDYENFSQFLSSEELSFSREKAYMCIRIYEYYIEQLQLSEKTVRSMNIGRLSMMIPLLKDKSREDAIQEIEEMNSLRHNEFVREVRKRYSRDGKPTVYWSEEHEKWICTYYDNKTVLHSLGNFEN